MDLTEKIFESLENAVQKAGWECDIDDDRGAVEFTKIMSFGDDFTFTVPYDTNVPEQLMDEILSGIDEKSEEVCGQDFAAELVDSGLSMSNGSAFRYANKVITAINNLGSYVGEEFDIISLEPEELELDEEEFEFDEENEGGVLDDILEPIEALAKEQSVPKNEHIKEEEFSL